MGSSQYHGLFFYLPKISQGLICVTKMDFSGQTEYFRFTLSGENNSEEFLSKAADEEFTLNKVVTPKSGLVHFWVSD